MNTKPSVIVMLELRRNMQARAQIFSKLRCLFVILCSVSKLLRFSPLDCGSGRCRESAECRTALFSSENGQTRFCGKRVGSCAVVQPGPPTYPSVRSMVYPPEEYLLGLTTDRFVPQSAMLIALVGPQLSRRSVIPQSSRKLRMQLSLESAN